MSDDNEIIDVEAVEIEDSNNLLALRASTRSRMDTAPPPRWSEEWWAGVSPETRSHRCVAHKANGDRCLKLAIKGATVCRTHGGATRHVKRAARVRLENAAELMAKQLLGIALTADSEGVKLAAIKDALDRAGLKAPSEVVLSQGETKAYEQVFDVIGGTAPDESPDLSSGYGSAGDHTSPAAAYGEYDHGGKAEAGGDVTGDGDTGYADAYPEADEQSPPSSTSPPPRQGRPRDNDRHSQPQHREGRPSGDRPTRREVHITGMAAIRMANEANRDSGVWQEQRAIESGGHVRYREHRR